MRTPNRRPAPRRTSTYVVLAVLAAVLASACGGHRTDDPDPATPLAGARTGGTGPGSLLSATSIPDLDDALAEAGVRAARVTYRSTNSGSAAPTVVSGTVFAPDREAPDGGWPVVALGHGSTGITPPCAPSASPSLGGQVELIVQLVRLGAVVAMSDFEGLGEPGTHPYVDSRTAGLNVIDSVRAARATFEDVGPRWAAFGGSQGGGAVWAADEQAGFYAPELDLVGAMAVAPVSDVTGLVDKAVAGTLTPDQRGTFQWILASLGRLHPDLDLDNFRRGYAAAHWDLLSSCKPPPERDLSRIGADDLRPASPAAAALLKRFLAAWALPRGPLSAPLLVVYGAKDSFLDPGWTTAALDRACELGGTIERRLDPEGTHLVMDTGNPVRWLADRFDGKPATNDC